MRWIATYGDDHRSYVNAQYLVDESDLARMPHDADFNRIAAVTGQPVEWVIAHGKV